VQGIEQALGRTGKIGLNPQPAALRRQLAGKRDEHLFYSGFIRKRV